MIGPMFSFIRKTKEKKPRDVYTWNGNAVPCYVIVRKVGDTWNIEVPKASLRLSGGDLGKLSAAVDSELETIHSK